jgi:hypothetical protein
MKTSWICHEFFAVQARDLLQLAKGGVPGPISVSPVGLFDKLKFETAKVAMEIGQQDHAKVGGETADTDTSLTMDLCHAELAMPPFVEILERRSHQLTGSKYHTLMQNSPDLCITY